MQTSKNRRDAMSPLILYLALANFLVYTSGQSCPTAPVVYHSTLQEICSKEPAQSAIGCSMYRLCNDKANGIYPTTCSAWKIASSLCSDDSTIVASYSSFCAQLQSSYSSAAQFQSCMQPYTFKNTVTMRDIHLYECDAMDGQPMGGCDTCTHAACPDPLYAYCQGCIDMDMGQCSDWKNFCLNGDGAPLGKAAAVLCIGNGTTSSAPSWPPSPPPDPPSPSPSPPPPPPPSPPSMPPPTQLTPETPASTLCVTNSSLSECASYVYPAANVTADLNSLCTQMPYMPGCTIMFACQNGTATGDFCRPFTLLSSICYDMPGMSGCKSYRTLCANTSVVPQCKLYPAIPGLPTTKQAKTAVTSICANVSAPECVKCNGLSCPDYLQLLLAVCPGSPAAPGCETYTSWCNASAAWAGSGNLGTYCPALISPPPSPPVPRPPPVVVLGAGTPPPPASAAALCVLNSSLPECVSYVYPDSKIAADLKSLCTDMPYMPGCTIMFACQSGEVTGDFCRNMTLLSTICYDMPGMGGCKSYRTLCANTSVVDQCKLYPAIPGLPTTKKAAAAVTAMCSSMYMTQCDTCSQIACADYIGAISSMCAEMPYMDGCDVYASWCAASSVWEQSTTVNSSSTGSSSVRSYCAGASVYGGSTSSSSIPSMLMFFHQRVPELLLFRSWLPKTTGQAVGSFFAITGMGMASVALRTVQAIAGLAAATGRLGPLKPAAVLTGPWWLPTGGQVLFNSLICFLTILVMTLDMFTMLIAMTFNGAYFAAVVLGYGLGALFFGHLRENYQRHLAQNGSLPPPTTCGGVETSHCAGAYACEDCAPVAGEKKV